MNDTNLEEGSYRVLLLGFGDDTPEKKEIFCSTLSEKYRIPLDFLHQIVERCPVVLRKNLSRKKAETFVRVLRSYGALAAVEERRELRPISLEFQEIIPPQALLVSSRLRRTAGGQWTLIGRIKNLCRADLVDLWVLVQVFEKNGEILTFEESTLPINPLPPEAFSPFKVILDAEMRIESLSIAFKTASGVPVSARDGRKKTKWVKVDEEEDEAEQVSSPSSSGFSGNEPMPGAQSHPPSEENDLFLPKDPSVPAEKETTPVEEEQASGLENGKHSPEEETPLFSLKEMESVVTGNEGRLVDENEVSQAPVGPPPPEEASPLLLGLFDGTETEQPEAPQPGERAVEEEEKEGLPSFPWMEDFRNSVIAYSERDQDPFSTWFREIKGTAGFQSPFHAVLTILLYSRFDPFTQGEKALRNTRKVYAVVVEPNPSREAIPPMEGTSFFPDEQWRELLYRAIPRLHQISRQIVEQGQWNAPDLERLVQVVPHMSDRISRASIRRMKDLLPGMIGIDSSRTTVTVTENLYRVAARLGIVDPRFDFYHGVHSMGDLRIQSFAKAVFPDDPAGVEGPMEQMGLDGVGPCLPIQPCCARCLFDAFCPKQYLTFNPAEKGVIGRNGQSKSGKG